jgi:hypothetical protein
MELPRGQALTGFPVGAFSLVKKCCYKNAVIGGERLRWPSIPRLPIEQVGLWTGLTASARWIKEDSGDMTCRQDPR